MGLGRLSGCCFTKQCTCFKHSRAEADDAKRLKLLRLRIPVLLLSNFGESVAGSSDSILLEHVRLLAMGI